MLSIQKFTFNPFSENTYILFDETLQCIIIDPGMSNREEEAELDQFITANHLIPVKLVNTHCHIDHILGNAHCATKYNLSLYTHALELLTLQRGEDVATAFGIHYNLSPMPTFYVEEKKPISFGSTTLEVLFVPGHSPGHIALVCTAAGAVISGDVLFNGSVGRVDLPGCSAADLINSIQQKLYKLPDSLTVYAGHGPETTIGQEKRYNTFVRENEQNLL